MAAAPLRVVLLASLKSPPPHRLLPA